MAEPKEKVILPERYFLDYFRYVCDFVQEMYPDLVGPQQEFIDAFFNLPVEAQCLYLRLNNRKGCFFRLEKLTYPEISDIEKAAGVLCELGFTRMAKDDDPLAELLPIFTKGELVNIWNKSFPESTVKQSSLRPAIEALFLDAGDAEMLNAEAKVIVQLQVEHVELIKIMFFGQPYGDLNQFVARDVGHVLTPFEKQKSFKRLFEKRGQIDELWKLLCWYEEFKFLLTQEIEPDQLVTWIKPKVVRLEGVYPTTRVISDKFCYKVGVYFEQNGFLDEALKFFALSERPEAYRRRLMVLNKLKDVEETLAYARWLSKKGKNATLKILGQDYCARLEDGARVQRTTDRLKQARMIEVYYDKACRIEGAVLDYYRNIGYQGFFSENYTWRSLFGLIYWDILYDFSSDAIHQPLQRVPSDLYDGFYEKRQAALENVFEAIPTLELLAEHLHNTIITKKGQANPFVHWHENLGEHIQEYLNWLNIEQIRAVLTEMAKNPKENATGFPDLFVFNDQEYAFYEVKSPNDHLSAQQWYWINFFEEVGISVDILKTR